MHLGALQSCHVKGLRIPKDLLKRGVKAAPWHRVVNVSPRSLLAKSDEVRQIGTMRNLTTAIVDQRQGIC